MKSIIFLTSCSVWLEIFSSTAIWAVWIWKSIARLNFIMALCFNNINMIKKTEKFQWPCGLQGIFNSIGYWATVKVQHWSWHSSKRRQQGVIPLCAQWWHYIYIYIGIIYHFDGLVQERRNSTAYALELLLSCTNLSICWFEIEILPCGRQGPLYPTQSNMTADDLVIQRAKASQPWYWLSSSRMFWP